MKPTGDGRPRTQNTLARIAPRPASCIPLHSL